MKLGNFIAFLLKDPPARKCFISEPDSVFYERYTMDTSTLLKMPLFRDFSEKELSKALSSFTAKEQNFKKGSVMAARLLCTR